MQETELRTKFALRAISWLGVPYQHRGYTRNGCDCTGLLIGAAKECGFLKGYKPRKYPKDWNLHRFDTHVTGELKKFAEKVPNSKADVGDILVFYFGRNLSHCGVLVDKKKMLIVHCYRTTKKVCKAIVKNSMYAKRWKETYRLKAEIMNFTTKNTKGHEEK